MADEVCIVVFPSTHFALKAEKAAKRARIIVRMIPVPRAISSDCNMGMEAPVEDMDRLREVLDADGVECEFVVWRKQN